ncbi:MAG: HAD-IIIC family phosphatase [Gemmatimonadetes bacterium]|nr:HAD-IIIC family phosphatase [Gemmatimonadota bacterium]
MTSAQVASGVLVSDFNTQNLASFLTNSDDVPDIEVREAPYGQVEQVLYDPGHSIWTPRPDFTVVWTQPAAALPTFRSALAFEASGHVDIREDVERFAAAVGSIRDRVDTVIVPTWTLPPSTRGLGPIDYTHPMGLRRLLLEANLALVEALADRPGVILLDGDGWIRAGAEEAINERLWYLAKVPFGNAVFREAAREIRSTLRAAEGDARKLLVLDLDNTLWGGVVGDDGWESIVLGGHDADGEAFQDFQRALKGLANRGIVLGIASKNQERTALEAIERHPEMVLSHEDFAAWRINWDDKARNIAELTEELNLGLGSVVFIDDSPAERARVREALPEVLVPEWPSSPAKYATALAELTCFDSLALTEEDRARGGMYRAERDRRVARTEVDSIEEWLATLETELTIERLTPTDLARAAQLLNKTNQMNMATRRMGETELARWADADENEFWTVRVSDRFGAHGLTGLIGLTRHESELHVVDFVLSCRVMGRNVERSMWAWIVARAKEAGLERVYAIYRRTERNQPCLEFLEGAGLVRGEDEGSFGWDSANEYAIPTGVSLVETDATVAVLPR